MVLDNVISFPIEERQRQIIQEELGIYVTLDELIDINEELILQDAIEIDIAPLCARLEKVIDANFPDLDEDIIQIMLGILLLSRIEEKAPERCPLTFLNNILYVRNNPPDNVA